MFEVVKNIYYREKRDAKGAKVDDATNGVVRDVDNSIDSTKEISGVVDSIMKKHGISGSDVLLGTVNVKVIDSSVVVKLYEAEDGKKADRATLKKWKSGGADLFLGCYKYDIQKVVRDSVDFGDMEIVSD